jgi:hypothetical protein
MSKSLGERLLFYAERCRGNFGSARLRGEQPASWFDAKYVVGRKLDPEDILGRDIFILIKSSLETYRYLQPFGRVFWDVIDEVPPLNLDYIVSTSHAAQFLGLSNYTIIPHPPAKGASTAPLSTNRAAYWIGDVRWKPKIEVPHVTVNPCSCSPEELDTIYRKAGVLLNVRNENPEAYLHSNLSSGIKLINAISYAIPSISSDEAWVNEVGPECTVVDDVSVAMKLFENARYYEQIRENCLKRQHLFSIGRIKGLYRTLFDSL